MNVRFKCILVACLLAGALPTLAQTNRLFENDFEKAEIGKLPEGFDFAVGEFAVKEDAGNKFLELPGAPLDSFSIQFGPVESTDIAVSGRILGTTKSRRMPTFGIGLGGVAGYKLQVSPAKKALELYLDQDLKGTAVFDWKAGEWTQLRLQIRKVKDSEWQVEGKAWQGGAEPEKWTLVLSVKEEPVSGRASVLASPFAGTPIWFDDLVVEREKFNR